METEFLKFIEHHSLLQPGDKTLLTVSGGKDSITLCVLFARSGRKFGIAHCNFGLRGKDSVEDEEFVKELAQHYKVPFYCKRFQTNRYARAKKISIQMAARELRYEWFLKIAEKEKYDCIATAHHLDDQLETFFINLLRSSGIAGLHGILPRQGKIIHPMLFTWRSEIEEFVKENNLSYREDRSNQENKYLRNRIRHQLIPQLIEINPEFRAVMTENIRKIRDAEIVYRDIIDKKREEAFFESAEGTSISIAALKEASPLSTFLFEFLFPYGFTSSQVNDIAGVVEGPPGAIFFSPSWRLVKDRDRFILTRIKNKAGAKKEPTIYRIKTDAPRIKEPLNLTFEKKIYDKNFRINPAKEFACLDLAKLSFPLTLRKWEPGDAFYPFGKYIRKKVSDFFIDEKLTLPEKENVWLLCSGNRIVWVVGYRIDHRFRITNRTKEVWLIHLKK